MTLTDDTAQAGYEWEHCIEFVCSECGEFSMIDPDADPRDCPECGGEVVAV